MLIRQSIRTADKVLLKHLGRRAVEHLPLGCLLGVALPCTLPLVDSGRAAVDLLLEWPILLFPLFELLPFLVFAQKN